MEILNRKLSELKEKISKKHPVAFTEKPHSSDFFSVERLREGVHVRYSNLRSALFAASVLDSNRLNGEYPAKSSWRILQPGSTPLDESFFETAVKNGFNAVVLGIEQNEAASLAKQFDLKILLKVQAPNHLPFAAEYEELLRDFVSTLPTWADAFYWQSSLFELDCKSHLLEHSKLKVELYLEEMRVLESFKPYFYVVPELPLRHYALLESYLGPKAVLVGPSFLPIIDRLNQSVPLFLATWTQKLFDHGAIMHIDARTPEDFSACHLQAAGQALWGLSTFEESGWSWLSRHRPEINRDQDQDLILSIARFSEHYNLFEKVKNGSCTKSHEELKLMLEGIQIEIKLFNFKLLQWQKRQPQSRFFAEAESYIEGLSTLCQEVQKISR